MRIISGDFKGKKIEPPKDRNTRPLKDLTKESIFNVISHSNKFSINLEISNVLDLFSGVGSFGLECLSRRCKHVTFVENYIGVLPILEKNLSKIVLKKNFNIIKKDIVKGLQSNNYLRKYNLIFLDPPYKNKDLYYTLNNLFVESLIDKGGIIIIHRHKKDHSNYPKNFNFLEERTYGISKITYGIFI